MFQGYVLNVALIIGSIIALMLFVWICFYARIRSIGLRFMIALTFMLCFAVLVVAMRPLMMFSPAGTVQYPWNVTVPITVTTAVNGTTTTSVTYTVVQGTVTRVMLTPSRFGDAALSLGLAVVVIMAILLMVLGIIWMYRAATGQAR